MVQPEEVDLGDLVLFDSKSRGIIKGLIMADESASFVIKGHLDIKPEDGIGHIVAYEDVIRVVKKRALGPKSLIRGFFS